MIKSFRHKGLKDFFEVAVNVEYRRNWLPESDDDLTYCVQLNNLQT